MLVIGFAAETTQTYENARKKLQEKGLDLIIANDVGQPQPIFGAGPEQGCLYSRQWANWGIPLDAKVRCGREISQLFDTQMGAERLN